MKVAKLDSDWISYTSQNLFREMVIHSHYGIFSFKLKIFIRFCMKLNHFSSFEKNNYFDFSGFTNFISRAASNCSKNLSQFVT